MKKLLFIFLLTFVGITYAQNTRMAYDYFRKGEYKKAASLYKPLHEKNKNNRTYFKNLLRSYQELDEYSKAEDLLSAQLKLFPKQFYLIAEQGYNYQLKKQPEKADSLYQQAIKYIEEKPSTAYLTGRSFQENNLLDYAITAYKKAMEVKPSLNFSMYIANIYGEKGEIDNMFNAFLDMVESKPNYITSLQRYVGKFITDDNQNENNVLFRKLVLKRLQNNPNNTWNKLLSWLFKKQKDYYKALVQEKAIYKRSNENLNAIFELAEISFNDKDYQTAIAAYQYIKETATLKTDVLQAENKLLVLNTINAKTEEDFIKIDLKYQQVLNDLVLEEIQYVLK